MNNFESNNTINERTLEAKNNSISIEGYSLDKELNKINAEFLESLVEKLAYSEQFHKHTWKLNGFINIEWSKSF